MISVPSPLPISASSPASFAWQTRVYYEDTDAGGIVFYANYLKFFERARTEWLRAGGIDQSRLSVDTGTLFVVRRTAVDYHAPARLDDLLRIESHVARMGRASVEFEQHAFRAGDRLCSGTILVACVHATTLRPTGLPPPVIAALQHEH
jgi:acyl-CoA thioester hydrolase